MPEKRKLRAGEKYFTWLILGFSLFLLIQAYLISGFSSVSSPGTFPMGASAVMVLAVVLVLVNNRKLEKPKAENMREELRLAGKEVVPLVFLVYTGIIIAYMILIKPIHFLPSSFAFLLASMVYLKGGSIIRSLIISAVSLACIYFVFQFLFRVMLP